jgi:hypothetical protein
MNKKPASGRLFKSAERRGYTDSRKFQVLLSPWKKIPAVYGGSETVLIG